jgi:hypothetical protein
VDAVLRVPHDFERDLVRTREAPAQLVLNAEDGAPPGVTLSYAQRIVGAYAASLGSPGAIAANRTPAAREAPAIARMLDVRTRGWYNPTLRYSDYMVPGILVELVTLIGTLLTALNIVREKELGTLEQLNVTPSPAPSSSRPSCCRSGRWLSSPWPSGSSSRGGASGCRSAAASRSSSPRPASTSSPRWASDCSSRRAPKRSSRRCS